MNRTLRVAALVTLVSLGCFAHAGDLRYFNVVPIIDGNVAFAAQEVRRQAKLGVKEIAVSLSYHPQCTPAAALLPIHAENFRKLKAELAGSGVTVGVLIQSTAGHGWNRKMQIFKEPWQKSVYADGHEGPRCCQLGPEFRAYVLEAIRTISKEDPAFLLIDDDFGPRNGEGFCPLHVARYNRATGQNLSAEEWMKLANGGDRQDPVRQKMEASRLQVPVEFAREIRAAIDSVNPAIRCGMCTPGKGAAFTREVALALAGPKTRPFIRIFNAVYGRMAPSVFFDQLCHVRQLEAMFEDIDEIVAEADTWPQNYWSEPARMFGAHLYFDVLYGLDGAKIWMSEFERAADSGSQARFEKVFSEELPMREALYDLVKGKKARFHGLASPVNWGDWASDSTQWGAWDHVTPLKAFFMPFGFPCEVARVSDGDPQKIWVLTRDTVKLLSDDEIRTLLSRRVFIDSIGAKELTRRGFSSLMGVEATDGPKDFAFNRELPRDGQLPLRFMWDESAAHLKPLSDKVETLTDFTYRDPFMKADEVRSPGLTLFSNAAGGKIAVAGWTFDCGGWSSFAKYTLTARKELLVKTMDRLAGGTLPFVACENNPALMSWATLDDGTTLLSATNVSIDDWKNLRVRLPKAPVSAKMLLDDGTFRDVASATTGPNEVTFQVGEMRCLKPVTLLVR